MLTHTCAVGSPTLSLPLPLPPPSAGVGRTGVFIALDHLLDQVQTEEENALIDIPALVSTMRTQRGTMVQASVGGAGGGSREGRAGATGKSGVWGTLKPAHVKLSHPVIEVTPDSPLQLQHV